MTEISDWRRRIERYRLIGSRCRECGAVYYPKRFRCVKCGSMDMEAIELPKRGVIKSYTVVRQLPDRYNRYKPYILALIELEEGLTILGQIVDIEPDEVKEGMEVEATFRKLYEYRADGKIIYGLKFRPVVSSEASP